MNKPVKITRVILIICICVLLGSCEKKQVPVLETSEISNITGTTATSGGKISDEGSGTIISRGVCWSTGQTPTISDNKTSDGAGAGSFTSNLADLNGVTKYFVRAYATNSAGTGYGMAMSFTTLGLAPVSSNSAVTNLTATTATLKGTVNANYLSTVVTFEYGTTTSYGSTVTPSQSPVTGYTITNVSADITGLTAATIYHFRIKSVNFIGTTYSNDLTFTTLGQIPTVTVIAATSISVTGATLNGTVNANYLSSTVTFEFGTTASYGSTATATPSSVTGYSATNVSTNVTDLTAGTTYHFRIKAVNSLGTNYGDDLTFKTLGQIPSPTTQTASNIQIKSATLNGIVNANYLSSTVTFEYGLDINYGNTAIPSQSPVTGATNNPVNVDISNLTAGTSYHFRVKAINSLGPAYGDDMTFTTLGKIPTDSTKAATLITTSSATLNGTVNANYLTTIVTFEYGLSPSYGQIVTVAQSPIDGNSNVKVSSSITGLLPETTYHFRIKAVNELGTKEGDDMTFITLMSLSDIEGNVYYGVTLGTQVWMTENIKTTKYSNGDLIGTTTPATLNIVSESTPKYQWAYGGDESTVTTYGRLYTWYAVTDSRNICPSGWHVPTDTEWSTLVTYLGNETFAGGKLKETGTNHWQSPNTGATNETSFTALPGGYRNGPFADIGSTGCWWSSSDYDATYTLGRTLIYNTTAIGSSTYHKTIGFSVRCLRD